VSIKINFSFRSPANREKVTCHSRTYQKSGRIDPKAANILDNLSRFPETEDERVMFFLEAPLVPHRKLGELLIERGLISEEQLHKSLEIQKDQGGRVGSILVDLGYLEEETLLNFLSLYFDIPQIDLRNLRIGDKALGALPLEKVWEHLALPIKLVENLQGEKLLMLAMADPTNFDAINDIQNITGRKVDPYIASYRSLTDSIRRHYEEEETGLGIDLYDYDPEQIARAVAKLLIRKGIINVEDLLDILEKDA